jgi:hypothetical protein
MGAFCLILALIVAPEPARDSPSKLGEPRAAVKPKPAVGKPKAAFPDRRQGPN